MQATAGYYGSLSITLHVFSSGRLGPAGVGRNPSQSHRRFGPTVSDLPSTRRDRVLKRELSGPWDAQTRILVATPLSHCEKRG